MDENEFAANMDLGRVFLEIMGRVVDEGFGFIAPELERWQDIGQNLLVRATSPTNSNSGNSKHRHPSEVDAEEEDDNAVTGGKSSID